MAREFTFRSPGFFEREIDLTARVQAPIGTPAGIVGTAQKGPAFVPVTVGSFPDFRMKFGDLDSNKAGPYAVSEFLKNRNAVTYMRILGAGANDTLDHIEQTHLTGQVNNAGFVVTGSATAQGDYHVGAVQFILAVHDLQSSELLGMPIFSDNDSYDTTGGAGSSINLVRAAIFTANDTRIHIMDGDSVVVGNLESEDDVAALGTGNEAGIFKLIISSSDTTYDTSDGLSGMRVLSASLNPDSANYISKILNTDPEKFGTEKHLLYLDFAVDDQLATVAGGADSIVIASGSDEVSQASGDTTMEFRDVFGHFDTRYTTPRTPWFISQPYGTTEHNLFYFESLDDGAYANTKFKVSIAQVRKADDPKSDWGTFSVLVRAWGDTDQDPEILEQFPEVTLNPKADNFIAKMIGDKRVRYDFDADDDEERRLLIEGRFANKSNIVRVVLNPGVEKLLLPESVLPFGFRGPAVLKTNDAGVDDIADGAIARLAYNGNGLGGAAALSGAIVPPLPYRFKVTRGTADSSNFAGSPGVTEIVDGRLYWGAKLERNSNALNPNSVQEKSALAVAYSKLHGLEKLDAILTGSQADDQNENKFTLARVAFSNTAIADLTGTVNAHMLETAYIRNGNPDGTSYTVTDGTITNRLTLASLASLTSSVEFNRFTNFTKFTAPMAGGFDGVNILDQNANRMNDKASSVDSGGGAATDFTPTSLGNNPADTGRTNNAIFSYRTAARIMTDDLTVNTNILAIPGIRDTFITDFASQRTRDYGLAMYIMDMAQYDDSGNRLFDDSAPKPDVRKTSENFGSRAIDNSYVATYFPDIKIDDVVNNRRVKVPASVAALAALSFNDNVAYPWFAPAGFNRGALEFVKGLDVRLDGGDRNTLSESRINPVAHFPREGIAIFGQKTLQFAKSALDRVNVQRLMLELKRLVLDVARRIVFEQNNVETRSKFVSQVTPLLGLVQAQQGIEGFKVVMDESNNTLADINANKMNGRIVVIPTRAVEFIAIDFIVTPSGVQFVQ